MRLEAVEILIKGEPTQLNVMNNTKNTFPQEYKSAPLTENDYNFLNHTIIESAIEVHKELGPGLMESVYEYCLCEALKGKGISVTSQVKLPIIFKGEVLDKHFILDILVGDHVILEIKSVERLLPAYEAQLASYLKLSGKKLGLLINFNEQLLKDGIRRRVNNFFEDPE
jgi:GxxExxY protein